MSNIPCPNCKYEGAICDAYSNGDEYVFCERCGFSYSPEEGEMKNPLGSWCCLIKGAGQVGSIDNKEFIKSLKSHLEGDKEKEIDECWFTFKKGKQWYVHDLIADRIMPFGRFKALQRVVQELER